VSVLAEVIFQDRRVEEGITIEAVVYELEESEEYPNGIRYSFQAHNDETNVLRYDNYNSLQLKAPQTHRGIKNRET
jgi:hypothetical protein